jgi:hypothetical protein
VSAEREVHGWETAVGRLLDGRAAS